MAKTVGMIPFALLLNEDHENLNHISDNYNENETSKKARYHKSIKKFLPIINDYNFLLSQIFTASNTFDFLISRANTVIDNT